MRPHRQRKVHPESEIFYFSLPGQFTLRISVIDGEVQSFQERKRLLYSSVHQQLTRNLIIGIYKLCGVFLLIYYDRVFKVIAAKSSCHCTETITVLHGPKKISVLLDFDVYQASQYVRDAIPRELLSAMVLVNVIILIRDKFRV